MTPRRSETQCFTEVMFCSLFSAEIMWRKLCHTAADHIYFHRVVKYVIFFYYFLFFLCLQEESDSSRRPFLISH